MCTEKSPPETMPTKSAQTVKSGISSSMATHFGHTRNRTESRPITSRASISSEIFMVAISAVKAAPARPAQDQGSQQRAKLIDERHSNQAGYIRKRADFFQLRGGLQSQDDPCAPGDHPDNGHGPRPDPGVMPPALPLQVGLRGKTA